MYSRSTLFLAAAIFTGSAVTAGATDVYQGEDGGSIKDNAIETIMVPEAIEIPETHSWYLRGDFGYNFSTTSNVETSAVGVTEPDPISSASIGFGRLLSPNLRMDFTADYRNDDSIYRRNGTFFESFQRAGTVTIPNPADPTTTIDVDDVITFTIETAGTETVTFQNHAVMANLYYDFDKWGGFRPYVGAGVGMSIFEIQSTRAVDYVDCTAAGGSAVGPLVNCDIEQADIDRASDDRVESQVQLGWAVSATAGASLDISESMKVDMNYKVTYSSASSLLQVGGVGDAVSVEDKLDQEIRIGLRYDIW